jgi:predicted HTH transcriptional regulator
METGHKQDKQATAANATNPSIPSGTRQKPAKPVTVTVKTPVKMSVKGSPKSSKKTPVETLGKTLGKTPARILAMLQRNPMLTVPDMAHHISKSESAVQRAVLKLQAEGRLRRVGSRKGGHWETIDKNEG